MKKLEKAKNILSNLIKSRKNPTYSFRNTDEEIDASLSLALEILDVSRGLCSSIGSGTIGHEFYSDKNDQQDFRESSRNMKTHIKALIYFDKLYNAD